jgi:hypothetical protein
MSSGGARLGAGRKPGSTNKATAELRELAQEYAPAALEELARLAVCATSEAARVAAIKEILDRAYGKSRQPLVGADDDQPIVTFNIIGLYDHQEPATPA